MDAEISDNVGGIAGLFDLLAIVNHGRIVIRALTRKNVPVVIADRIGHEMPFADDRIRVTRFLQQFGKGLLHAVEPAVAVVVEAVRVRIFAGLDDSAHRAADRVRHEAAVKADALSGDAIHARGLQQLPLFAIRTDGLCAEVITKQKDDVRRTFRCGKRGRGQQDEAGEKSANHGGGALTREDG